MGEEGFLELIEQAGGMTRQEAREAARATLRTLAERITPGEAEDVAVFLPGELREHLASGPDIPELFSVDELVRRVAKRESTDGGTATRHVHAVFAALGRVASLDALSDLGAQLSKDFDPLLDVAWAAHGVAPEPARPPGPAASAARASAPDEGDEGGAYRRSGAYEGVDRAFQRMLEVDARLLYGFVVPVLAICGLVVLLAFDPSGWLLGLAVVLLVLATLIVVLGIVRMLDEDDAADPGARRARSG